MLHGAAEPQAPMADSKWRTLGCGGRRCCRRRVRREQGGRAPEHGTVVSRSKFSRQCRGQHAKQAGPWGPHSTTTAARRLGCLGPSLGGLGASRGGRGAAQRWNGDSGTWLVGGQVAIADPCLGVARVGRAPAEFLTRVLASWRRMCAWASK